MVDRKIEGAMVTMAATPILVSLSYSFDKVEKAMETAGTILTPFGVVATVVALFFLWHSMWKQDEHHRNQINKMSEQHDEQITQMKKQHVKQIAQVRQQLLQMEASRREKTLREHIIAVSNNVQFYSEKDFDKGMYFIPYDLEDPKTRKKTDYVCVISWSTSYRSESKDKNYLFDLRYAMFQVPISFDATMDGLGMETTHIQELRNILKDKLKISDIWNYSFSLPRFESGYGQIADDNSSFNSEKLAINDISFSDFCIIIFSLSKIQSFNEDTLKLCANMAKKFNL